MASHTSHHSEDLAFVRRIMEGDEAASEELVRKYSSNLKIHAYDRGVPGDETQDVVQETFIAAIIQIKKGNYRGEASLATWLHSILRRKVADHFRRQPGYGSISLDNLEAGDQRRLIRDEFDQLIMSLGVSEAARKLPVRSRVILLMKYTEGLTLDELSRWMGVSIGQMSRELYRAQRMLKLYILNEKPTVKKSGAGFRNIRQGGAGFRRTLDVLHCDESDLCGSERGRAAGRGSVPV